MYIGSACNAGRERGKDDIASPSNTPPPSSTFLVITFEPRYRKREKKLKTGD
jgi:hypothetical protein